MQRHQTNYHLLIVLTILVLVGEGMLIYFRQPHTAYAATEPSVKTVMLSGTTLAVPSWNLFKLGNIWSIISGSHMIPLTYTPQLETVDIAHAPNANRVASSVATPLKNLVNAAAKDNIQLMLSSAYRSADDQKATYDTYAAMNGKQYVQEYVAQPGASEHQSGLAVDLASTTKACANDGGACSLDADAITWLRAHAAEYGFIERYPEGKQSITGISGEHWHYRYVGVPLAKALSSSNMTLDEFVSQTAPGYTK